ncbi:MAG TPA: ABC transporter ATP-binding protein [Candidatus Syntrophoarchaeum butanivorans]|uniref:ABC transporter ATP-binding protein n=1 Tax=Candidatus Syntropharchaeum butanivorans TaxID=1839936 RepID=A0A7C1B6U3_9EURY|nr:ABC transporter ATP-binding protein [Candidatus Syntrophoarchaeum butanivorans]
MSSAISIKNLCKQFGNVKALDSVSIEIPRGLSFALLGPNGAGKTTLVKIIATIMRPTSGDVTVDGHDIMREKEKVKAKIGLISHQTFLYEDLSAEENLIFFKNLYHLDDGEKRVEKALKIVKLFPRRYDEVRTFSRGMKQRLSIARALLHDPPILILDEPTSGLDLPGRRDFYEMIRRFKDEGRTVIITTHDVNEVRLIADAIGVLSSGKLLFSGRIESIEHDLEDLLIDLMGEQN